MIKSDINYERVCIMYFVIFVVYFQQNVSAQSYSDLKKDFFASILFVSTSIDFDKKKIEYPYFRVIFAYARNERHNKLYVFAVEKIVLIEDGFVPIVAWSKLYFDGEGDFEKKISRLGFVVDESLTIENWQSDTSFILKNRNNNQEIILEIIDEIQDMEIKLY